MLHGHMIKHGYILSVAMVTHCDEDSMHHSDISAHLSGPDGSSRPEQSLASSVSGSSPSAGQDIVVENTKTHTDLHRYRCTT